ncbi:MAG: DUF1796 family putative cysteine peptidase [Synechococcales bacterium]|nr:DUF1796 family putative cysteine peptidase [Synechococcales bacterium]
MGFDTYISLGNNCEAGLQFRRIGYEESSFFRFTFAPFESVIELIKNGFEGVFQKENLVPSADKMVTDSRYSISFHSQLISEMQVNGKRVFVESLDFDSIYRKEYEKIQYFIEKWNKVVSSDKTVLYFIKGERNTGRERAQLLLDTMASKYPGHQFSIIYLQLADFREEDWKIPNLFNRYFPKFAPISSAFDADIKAWDNLFEEFPLCKEENLPTHQHYNGSNGSNGSLDEPVSQYSLSLKEKVGAHWSSVSQQKADAVSQPVRWWHHAQVIRHINSKFSGLDTPSPLLARIHLIREVMGNALPLTRGISVGCGNGSKEISLVAQGIVESFDLYEFSESRLLQARQTASKAGVLDRINFHLEDALEVVKDEEIYDFAYWSASLHHMTDVRKALRWNLKILKQGGLFYMENDYIGPNRLQWTNKMMKISNGVRSSLPDKYMASREGETELAPRKISRINVEKLMAVDPTEAADSESILEAIHEYFPKAKTTLTGGMIYHIALDNILHNFKDSEDEQFLNLLLKMDDLCIEAGYSLFATSIAVKS